MLGTAEADHTGRDGADVHTDDTKTEVLTAEDVMSAPVVTVRTDTPIEPAAALLASHGFTSAPVLDGDDRLVGIVTEADLLRSRFLPAALPAAARPTLVHEVMTYPPGAMYPDDDLADVASAMLTSDARSVPIVDGRALVGIVTRRDLLRVVARGERTSAEVRRRRGLSD